MPKELPMLFLKRLEKIHPENFGQILQAFSEQRSGSFRINTLKPDSSIFQEFSQKNIDITPFPAIQNCYTFDRSYEYAIKGTSAFYGGKIYLQSISSLLPAIILAPKPGEKILDICAAPGSKTTQISALQGGNGEIIALEKNQIRYEKLLYNCRLQGAKNIQAIKIDAEKFLENSKDTFHKILLDAPCSAEGRIYTKNEKSFGFWSENNILKKSELQKRLLISAWKTLKKQGTLVYSTCTLAPEENEKVISDFLKNTHDAELHEIELPETMKDICTPNISSFGNEDFSHLQKKCIRILPSSLTEGFFIARLYKKY